MAVLLLLLVLIAETITDKTISPIQYNGNPNSFSNRYVYVVPNNGRNYLLDNVYHEYLVNKDDNYNYTAYFTAVYNDGTVRSCCYLTTINSISSTMTYSSPCCSFDETSIGKVGKFDVFSRRITCGPCGKMLYPVMASSIYQIPPTPDEVEGIKQLLRRNGYVCPDLLVLPGGFPSQSVANQSSNSSISANCPEPCYNLGYLGYYSNYLINYPTYYPNYNPNICGCYQLNVYNWLGCNSMF